MEAESHETVEQQEAEETQPDLGALADDERVVEEDEDEAVD
jgi:hypothetical protein